MSPTFTEYTPRTEPVLATGAAPAARDDWAVVRRAVEALRAYWWVVLGVPLLAGVIVIGRALRAERTYTAAASFMPDSRRSGGGGLSGLAAQFGVSLPGSDGGQSPAFYAELARSRSVLAEIAADRFTLEDRRTGTYAQLFGIVGESPAHVEASVIERLSRQVSSSIAQKMGVVQVGVTTTSAALSQQIADSLVAVINRFNLERRQSQAVAERHFAERRMAEARLELRTAEQRLLAFLQSNRIRSAPDLSLEEDRLMREVGMRQSVYSSIAQSYEQARIDAVRDTPVITIVEPPVLPLKPDPRGLVGKALLCLVLGGAAGAVLAMALDARARQAAARRLPRRVGAESVAATAR